MGEIPEVSVVVPCHNEAENLRALMAGLRAALAAAGVSYEIVVTDDASTDGSWAVLKELAAGEPRLRVRRFAANCGESAASWAGMQAARAPVILTIDADLQNDPADIPRFLAALADADCVCGTRVEGRGSGDGVVRVVSSRIANLRFFKGIHRFLPTLIRMEGYRVREIPVANRPRVAGKSHYGIGNRVFSAFADLLAVRWMRSRAVRYEVRESVN